MMEKLVFTNSANESITLDYSGDFILDSWAGMGAAEVIPITTKGYRQNGYGYNGLTLGMRIIPINIRYAGDYYRKKRIIDKIFNPLLGEGVLTYTNDFISKSITVITTMPPTPVDRDGFHVTSLELTAYDPLFYDTAENACKMADYQGGLTFPFKFDPSIRFAQKGDVARIMNDGDVATSIKAEFRGPATKPKLFLGNTGELIEVNTTIAEGERLWINTAYGNKTVIHEKADGSTESAYNLITTDSKFFQLQIGENNLSFAADSGEPEVYLYWRNRYVGL